MWGENPFKGSRTALNENVSIGHEGTAEVKEPGSEKEREAADGSLFTRCLRRLMHLLNINDHIDLIQLKAG